VAATSKLNAGGKGRLMEIMHLLVADTSRRFATKPVAIG